MLVDHTFKEAEEKALLRTLVKFGQEVDRRLSDEGAEVRQDVISYVSAVQKGVNDKNRRNERHKALLGRIRHHFVPMK